MLTSRQAGLTQTVVRTVYKRSVPLASSGYEKHIADFVAEYRPDKRQAIGGYGLCRLVGGAYSRRLEWLQDRFN